MSSLINTSPKKEKNREIEVSFLETVNSSEISERFANYIIRGNYRNFLSKKVITNYLDKKKSKKFRNKLQIQEIKNCSKSHFLNKKTKKNGVYSMVLLIRLQMFRKFRDFIRVTFWTKKRKNGSIHSLESLFAEIFRNRQKTHSWSYASSRFARRS